MSTLLDCCFNKKITCTSDIISTTLLCNYVHDQICFRFNIEAQHELMMLKQQFLCIPRTSWPLKDDSRLCRIRNIPFVCSTFNNWWRCSGGWVQATSFINDICPVYILFITCLWKLEFIRVLWTSNIKKRKRRRTHSRIWYIIHPLMSYLPDRPVLFSQ